ncbi:MAG: hypothetical protein K0R98_507 [Rickettsiaceae bacterium]|jgi:hypothetical protein|nr:hypothetical protein [Rickettsiaceae bacterium]
MLVNWHKVSKWIIPELTSGKLDYQRGNLLVTTLLILVIMNILGAGLLSTSTKEYSTATYKIVDSQVLQITNSCTHDVMTWFEGLTAKPTTLTPVSVSSLNFMYTGTETQKQLNKLSGYSYSCTITYINSKIVSVGTGIGSEVGSTGGSYGGTGGTTLKDYYLITSTGAGPNNSTKVVYTIISVSY